MDERCEHFAQIRPVRPRTRGCEECMQSGERWIGLRLCLICGHVGCCDDSPNTHATKHFHATQHPMIRSLEPGDRWGWCYLDRKLYDPMPSIGLWSRFVALLRGRRGTSA